MSEPASAGPAPSTTTDAGRLTELEHRVDRLDSRRDGLLVFTFVLASLAMLAAIVGVGFGARAIDESKKNVKAGAAAPATGSAAVPCSKAGGFAAGAQVQDKGTKPAAGTALAVDAGDFFFDPTCGSDVAAGTVTLTVHNTGRALHNVTIADQNIDQDVEAGQTITVQVKVGSSPVHYVCKYHRTSGMVGALLPAAS